MSLYAKRGVSAQKEDVHRATEKLDKGLYPYAFCKLYPDYLSGDDRWVNVMHADGAGTKSILAYLYWRETGDLSVWKGIARDAIVMNLDDLLCTGITDRILFSSTIDRNKRLIPGEVLTTIIEATNEFFEEMAGHGVNIHYLGGETADVGDVVRTIAVNGTMTARWPRAAVVSNEQIRHGDVVVGLASDGVCDYDTQYNSGVGSNGLTSARHDALSAYYGVEFPESFDGGLDKQVVYIGRHRLTDPLSIQNEQYEVGRLLLSPTRTYAPVVRTLLAAHPAAVHGMVHCSGGGQTKCLRYLPSNLRVTKNNLFSPPPIFQLIREAAHTDLREMYQVFNMGHRLEVFTDAAHAQAVIETAAAFGVRAQVVGHVEDAPRKEVELVTPEGVISYH